MILQLIRRSRAGDEQAFAAVFEQYKNLVYKTAYLMLDDAAEAEDALQEVFLRVHRELAGFDPNKGAFTTWLHRVTINYCLNHRRKWSPISLPLDDAVAISRDEPVGASLEDEELILLVAYLDGEITPAERELIQAHLAG